MPTKSRNRRSPKRLARRMSPMPRTVNRRLFCLFISGCSFIAVTRSALETRSPTGCVWIPTTEFTAWIWQFGGAHNDVCPPGKIPVKIPLSSKDILKCKTKFFLLGTCPMWRIWIVCFMKQGPSTSRSTNGTCPKWRGCGECLQTQAPSTSRSTIGTCPKWRIWPGCFTSGEEQRSDERRKTA